MFDIIAPFQPPRTIQVIRNKKIKAHCFSAFLLYKLNIIVIEVCLVVCLTVAAFTSEDVD